MELKTLEQANLEKKKVLMRVDYNVPLYNGEVADDTRITESLRTINYLLKKKAKIILISHLGRPKGKIDPKLSLKPVAEKLSSILEKPVNFVNDCIGKKVQEAVDKMKESDILMLENTRFHEEEKQNDEKFSKKLADLADIFVSDAFGTAHRAHASTEGIAHHIPAYAGFLIEKEIKALSPLLKDPKRPFTILLGGAKIDTKLGVIKKYIDKADKILLGGGLANTFIHARGFDVGKSLCEKDKIVEAQDTMLSAKNGKSEIIMPTDSIVSDENDKASVTGNIKIESIEKDMYILDIGNETIKTYEEILINSQNIIWNGPVGLFEKLPFHRGTEAIAKTLTKVQGNTYIGGGDTLEALKQFNIKHDNYTHVSTGGGAMLEFLEGIDLPGIKVLQG